MHEFRAKIMDNQVVALTSLTLPYENRQKSRQRVMLDNGEDAAIVLPRGTVLYQDDLLVDDDGFIARVLAADEPLSVAHCDDPLLVARACYHLGNRHIALQIGAGRLAYLHDHVLDAMLGGLGLTVSHECAPFAPEAGAYGGSTGHHHAH